MLRLADVHFDYPRAAADDRGFTLQIAGLRIAAGESVAMTGASGIGKTTVLRLAAGILEPTRGTVELAGVDLRTLGESGRRRHRLEQVGFVFQDFRLLEHLNVIQNVLLPFRLGGLPLDRAARERAVELLERLGIAPLAGRDVRKLSRGEQQRAAICRALVTRPSVILADEPTGNLDPANKQQILEALLDAARDRSASVLAVTHDHDLLDSFDRVVDLGTAGLREVDR